MVAAFRALAIVDHYTRECPVIEVDLSLPVVRVLEQLADQRGVPAAIRVDHGPEFDCGAQMVRAGRIWNST